MKTKSLIAAFGLMLIIDLSAADVLNRTNFVNTNNVYEQNYNLPSGLTSIEELKNEELTEREFNEIIATHKNSFKSSNSYTTRSAGSYTPPDNYDLMIAFPKLKT